MPSSNSGGTVTRRCSCRNPETGKNYGNSCPKRASRRHGTWSISHELASREDGSRRKFRRSGFTSSSTATQELRKVSALLAIPSDDDESGKLAISDLLESCAREKRPLPDYDETRRRYATGQTLNADITVAEWLDEWLAGKKRLRPTSLTRYECDVRNHLKPHIGSLRLDRLRVAHLDAMFEAINEANAEIIEQNALRRAALKELQSIPWKGKENRARRKALKEAIAQMPPFRKTTGINSQHTIKRTLRASLNTAIAQQIIPPFNAAAHVELAPAARAKALVWTPERVRRWERTGEVPSPVMVWTPEQTGTFLDRIASHRLYVLWHLIAFRGLRRGEACGLRWVDIDLDNQYMSVATQLVQNGWVVHEAIPKTDSGNRLVALDGESVDHLRNQSWQQEKEREAWGSAWKDTGRVFTEPDGSLLHPAKVSLMFSREVEAAGLPPVRLHDLRHGAATLALAAGVDIKIVSEMLGHSDTHITRDIYQSVLDDLARDAAEAVVKLVPRQRAGQSKARPPRRQASA